MNCFLLLFILLLSFRAASESPCLFSIIRLQSGLGWVLSQHMYEATKRLLGEPAVNRIRTAKVLVVGAGGIGCELLKELALAGFGEIHVIDLDTIDLSNLNRQFLFSRQHVKQSKAVVACDVASQFNPDVHLIPYVGNIITDPQFSPKWFRSFDIAFNALDNAEARRHVNKMCVSVNVPLIDCGSAGFAGQVQVILPQKSECYDCRSHPAPKTFPVCTIRSTPSQPIHCVVWAKSFLFALLFGPEEQPEEQNEDEEENKEEIEQLNKESNELSDLKSSLNTPDFMQRLINKVYVADIRRLLLAQQLWKDLGHAPKPLEVNSSEIKPIESSELDDQKVWTVEEALGVLKTSTEHLISRLNTDNIDSIDFDKDDEDTLDFVVAATILRSHIFGIPQRSKFTIKQMAGNIIPAVATTNAVVSGLGVVEALKILAGQELLPYLRDVNIFRSQTSALLGDKLQPPSSTCPVSSCARTTVRAAPSTTLQTLIEQVLQLKLGYDEVSLVTDKLLYDPDFDEQASRTLSELSLVDNFVTVVDEDDRRVNLQLYIDDGSELGVDDIRIPLKPTIKRSRDDNEEQEAANEADDKLEINEDGDIVLD